MATITYRKSNDGEPAKVFSGTMDRLLFMIVLRMKEKTEIKNRKHSAFVRQSLQQSGATEWDIAIPVVW